MIWADLIRLPDVLTPSEYLPEVFVAHAPEGRAPFHMKEDLMGQVLPKEEAGSYLPSCTKLEAFKLSSCHSSQVCIISFLPMSANLSLAVLVVPVPLLLLLALVVYFLSVLGAACFLSGFIQV